MGKDSLLPPHLSCASNLNHTKPLDKQEGVFLLFVLYTVPLSQSKAYHTTVRSIILLIIIIIIIVMSRRLISLV